MIGKLKLSIHFIRELSDEETPSIAASHPPYVSLSVSKVKETVKSRPWLDGNILYCIVNSFTLKSPFLVMVETICKKPARRNIVTTVEFISMCM